MEHYIAVEGRPLAKTSALPWTTAWPIILVLFPLPTSLFFFLSSSPHSSFPCPIFFLHSLHSWSHLAPHLTASPLPLVISFILVMYYSLVVFYMPTFLSVCLPISLFSAPLRLAHYFCSVVHSVWGWTRTPPWPPVRGERVSGTKTSIAPFSSPSSYPMIDDNSNSTNNITL